MLFNRSKERGVNKMKNKKLLTLVYTAMLAALCCVATMVIRIPTIGTNGYINLGDTVVLLSSWLLGNPFGAIAAGIGSGMADLLAGYGSYVPGTAIIKFIMGFVCALIYSGFGRTKLNKNISYVVGTIAAEAIMILGYFLYESTFLGYGIGAAASIGSNAIQGISCGVLAIILINVLTKIKYIQRLIDERKQ